MTLKLKTTFKSGADWQEAMTSCLQHLDREETSEALSLGSTLLDNLEPWANEDIATARFCYRLGETFTLAGQNEPALIALTKSINIYEAVDPNSFAMGRAMAWAAYCLLQVERKGEALSLLRRAEKVLEPFKNEQSDWLWVLATYAYHKSSSGQNRHALEAAKKCLSLENFKSTRVHDMMKICAHIARHRTKVGDDAAQLLQQLLDQRKKALAPTSNPQQSRDSLAEGASADAEILNQSGQEQNADAAGTDAGQAVPAQLIDERSLENLESESTNNWLSERLHLSEIALFSSASRPAIHKRSLQLYAYDAYSDVSTRQDRVFYFLTPAVDAKRYLMTCGNMSQFPKVLLRPGDYAASESLVFYQPSGTGRYVAYGLSEGGSDWKTIKIRDVETGEDFPDSLQEVRTNYVSWRDDTGFYYQRSAKPALGEKIDERSVYFHALNSKQEDDILVFRSAEGTSAAPWFVHDWLIISVYSEVDYNVRFFCRPEDDNNTESGRPFCILPDRFGDNPNIVTFMDGWLYLIVFGDDADRGKLIRYRLTTGTLRTVLPPTHKVILRATATKNNQLLVHTLNNCRSEMSLHETRSGRLVRKISMPEVSHAGLLGSTNDGNCLLRYESYTAPPSIQQLDFNTLDTKEWIRYDIPFDSHKYHTQILYCRSADGTRIPIQVCKRKDIEIADSPVLLNIYGGFQHCTVPHFEGYQAIWLEMGGTLAFVVARGGIEYGLSWHREGARQNKHKVVQDLLAASRYFQNQGVAAGRIAACGDSNGGLIVSAAMVQRPQAFGAVVIGNPLTDMLQFHKWLGGPQWIREYGDPDQPDVQPILSAYSPLQNLRAASYPATMIQVSINDDRVHKSHSYKFFHKLEQLQAGTAPILLRGYESSGHAQFSDSSYWSVDRLAFLADHVGLDPAVLKRLLIRDRHYEANYNPNAGPGKAKRK
jgi:prolyl oligopeptidase